MIKQQEVSTDLSTPNSRLSDEERKLIVDEMLEFASKLFSRVAHDCGTLSASNNVVSQYSLAFLLSTELVYKFIKDNSIKPGDIKWNNVRGYIGAIRQNYIECIYNDLFLVIELQSIAVSCVCFYDLKSQTVRVALFSEGELVAGLQQSLDTN